MGVASRPPDDLNEAAGAAQETFLVGVENANERDLGDIEAFTQEVDAHENIVFPFAELIDDFSAFQSLGLVMQIGDLDAFFFQERRQILRHFDGEGHDHEFL